MAGSIRAAARRAGRLVQDLHALHAARSGWGLRRTAILVAPGATFLHNPEPRAKSGLSAHRRLALHGIDQERTHPEAADLLDILAALPPFCEDGSGPVLTARDGVTATGKVSLCLSIDDVSVWDGDDLESLAGAVDYLVSLHARIAMGAALEPWMIVGPRELQLPNYKILADRPEAALARFAAVDRSVRLDVLSHDTLRCVRARQTGPDPDMIALLSD